MQYKKTTGFQVVLIVIVLLIINGYDVSFFWNLLKSSVNATVAKIMVAVLSIVASVVAYNFSYLYSIFKLLRMILISRSHDKKNGKKVYSFLDTFEEKVDNSGTTVQFIVAETGEQVTLHNLDALANQVGHWGLSKGYEQSDTIALMLLNSPDFVAIWLGFGKIGASSALLNTNLTGNAFIHSCEVSLKNSKTKILIVDSELKSTLAADLPKVEALGIKIYYWNANIAVESVKHEVITQNKTRIDKVKRNTIKDSDAILYIFTSGTTGLPKACKISNTRMFVSCIPYRILCDLTPKDRIYTVLPLYHSGGGMLGVGASLMSGATMVLRKKFSASNFTSDCLKYNVTSFQYIGELCRYLIAIPENERDKLLTIRTAYGNGMRPDVWETFQKRYHIKHIVEFYGATEGNASLFNCFDKVGALGHIPKLLDPIYPLKIIRTEPEDKTKPLRDAKGFCIECVDGEVGLLVSQIFSNRKFEGYSDSKATNDKILKNVLYENDSYFNSGDLISRDSAGYYYWSDRIGDTFRWKGENVATTEVSEVVSTCAGVKDVTVYGVSVPGCDGKAGMAAIAIHMNENNSKSTVDMKEMLDSIVQQSKKNLPAYSRPLFLRIKVNGDPLETTSTFKHVKGGLTNEGFNPSLVKSDALFYYHAKNETYIAISSEVFKDINDQKIRF